MNKLFFTLLIGISVSANATYNIVDLGDLGGNDSAAWGLNASGDAVGDSLNKSDNFEAFVYKSSSGLQGIGTLGGKESSAFSINSTGQVVGISVNSFGNDEAFLFENGVMSGLGTLGGLHSSASFLNDKGQVVGLSVNSFGENEAFIYDKASGMKGIGSLGGNDSAAWAINTNGTVVGDSRNRSGNFEAFIYKNGVMKGLGALAGGKDSVAWAINSSEQIVGESENSSGNFEAFVYNEASGMKGLGTLGGAESSAFGINDSEQIIGTSQNRLSDFEATLYENGRLIPLMDLVSGDTSGWTSLTVASGINNAGQIVGLGQFKGKNRAFLLNPVNDSIPIWITPDLDIHLHSTVFQSPGGNTHIWANLNLDRREANGDLIWKLDSFGEENAQPETFALVLPSLNIQIQSSVYRTVNGDLNIWANLIFIGSDQNGDFFWKLGDFGVNP